MKRMLGLAALVLAACTQPAGLTVADAVYRAPLVADAPGVAYFSITSAATDKIIGLSSPEAASVEMHASSTDANGMASMRKLDSVELPAGKTVTFGPGGFHVMVFSPTPRQASATFPIQITLESGRVETISFGGGTTGQ
jgi:periplasmic copper chaperone A